MAKAELAPRRLLSAREVATIRAGLMLLWMVPSNSIAVEVHLEADDDGGLLNDEDISRLLEVLRQASTVVVWQATR